jgi:hypothetical protein
MNKNIFDLSTLKTQDFGRGEMGTGFSFEQHIPQQFQACRTAQRTPRRTFNSCGDARA